MTAAVMTPTTGPGDIQRAPLRARVSWMLFDWASQPFYTLVQTFLFAPYFVNAVAADANSGQAMWGYAAATACLLIAIVST